eukprot:jgi/Pico_ML_1/52718/g3387.t1
MATSMGAFLERRSTCTITFHGEADPIRFAATYPRSWIRSHPSSPTDAILRPTARTLPPW